MNSTSFFYALGDFFQWTFGIFEIIGNSFNLFVLASGFFGFLYWMSLQNRFNNQAKKDSSKIK